MAVFNTVMSSVRSPLPATCENNCIQDVAVRTGGRILEIEGTLSANNTSETINLFKVTGTVEIIDAYGEITDATTLTNMTGCYFDLWDGTTAVEITDSAGGATLSGAPVGSMILKTGDSSNIATVVLADQCRVTEADSSKKTHHPFVITQKNGANTYIRCHYTTTDAPINAKVKFFVVYRSRDGGTLEVVS